MAWMNGWLLAFYGVRKAVVGQRKGKRLFCDSGRIHGRCANVVLCLLSRSHSDHLVCAKPWWHVSFMSVVQRGRLKCSSNLRTTLEMNKSLPHGGTDNYPIQSQDQWEMVWMGELPPYANAFDQVSTKGYASEAWYLHFQWILTLRSPPARQLSTNNGWKLTGSWRILPPLLDGIIWCMPKTFCCCSKESLISTL